MRITAGILIVLFWTGMTGLLIQREVLPGMRTGGPMASAQPAQFRPSSSHMGFYMNERRIGSIRSEVTPASDGSVNLVCVARIDFPLLRGSKIVTYFSARLDREHKLETFRIVLRSDLVRTCIRGRVFGDRLEVTTETGKREFKQVVPFDANVMVSTSLVPHLTVPDLEVGKRWQVRSFNPLAKMAYVTVEVKEKTKRRWQGQDFDVYRLESTYQGLTCNAWVTPDGTMLQAEVPFAGIKLILRKEDPLPTDDPD
ncbi:MAG: hypothetical protein GXP25_23430 [Planctomycetes bacterium]|nr:hypothetical protein [Planctomycetota bacterium]